MSDKIHYGGQAVMEGVMMRGSSMAVTAVRHPAGHIVTRVQKLNQIYTGRLRKTPFIRGVIVLVESLALGLSSLAWSANVALEEQTGQDQPKQEMSPAYTGVIIAFSLALAVGLFFITPLLLARLLDPFIQSSVVFHLVEGLIRLLIFILYLKLISLMPDIRRVFSYHGAEHKTINAYEHAEPMEAQAIQKYSTAHARCGTAFLLSVMVLAILVFSLVGRQSLWLMITSRILLLPVIASLGYELTQYGARHMANPLARALVSPGLWLQSMTTGQPDDNQVEVAVAALQGVLAAEQVPAAEPSEVSQPAFQAEEA